LYKNIASYIRKARNRVLQTVNTEQIKAYRLIGRYVVEEEQAGKEGAEYGSYHVFATLLTHKTSVK
jgi:hypothetical protein